MNENLSYDNTQETKEAASSQWNIANDSIASLALDPSKQFLQYRNYHLHLIQKKELLSTRRVIPSSKNERLSYYRNYVSSSLKTRIACMDRKSFQEIIVMATVLGKMVVGRESPTTNQTEHNIVPPGTSGFDIAGRTTGSHRRLNKRFFWRYALNTITKTLQHTYVHMFLASYAPEEHLFLSKMVPIMYGSKFSIIITGLIEVIAHATNTIILLHYLVGSLFLKNPWNRCTGDEYTYKFSNSENLKVKCYDIDSFRKKIFNKTVSFVQYFYYIEEDDEAIQLVQVEYVRNYDKNFSHPWITIYFCLIWAMIALCNKQIFNKTFWKAFHFVHWCVLSIDIISLAYLLVFYFREDPIKPNISQVDSDIIDFDLPQLYDMDFLAETMTAPPVVHVLTARSTQEISPGKDSAIFVLSNAMCVIFRALLSYKVKEHCESLVGAPIHTGFVRFAWLYFWPMYFSTFYLGDIFTLIFLLLHFTIEIMTAVVTFECLLEVVVSEWPKIPRWLLSMIFIFISITYKAFFGAMNFPLFMIVNKFTVTLMECLVLYIMYPIFRLVDDASFHYGSPLHFIRIQLLVLVPFYYTYKYYEFINITVRYVVKATEDVPYIYQAFVWALSLMLIPVILGMIYTLCKYKLTQHKDCRRIFAPAEDWGPRNYTVRQLRKDYDSRTYDGSQASRNLSRHIIDKAEAKTYRLGIRYDPTKISTVNVEVTSESEKMI